MSIRALVDLLTSAKCSLEMSSSAKFFCENNEFLARALLMEDENERVIMVHPRKSHAQFLAHEIGHLAVRMLFDGQHFDTVTMAEDEVIAIATEYLLFYFYREEQKPLPLMVKYAINDWGKSAQAYKFTPEQGMISAEKCEVILSELIESVLSGVSREDVERLYSELKSRGSICYEDFPNLL